MPPFPAAIPADRSTAARGLTRITVLVMAVATGTAVANNYFAQPLLPVIGRSLHVASGTAGLIVTVAQIGYAGGLLLILPLADVVERRRLGVTLCLLTAAGLLWFAAAPSAPILLPAAACVGLTTVLAQVLVPFAASLADDHQRGHVVGMVMSGLLVGILLARTVAGALAGLGNWRVVYVVAAALMLAQAVVLRFRLPTWRQARVLRYRQALASTLALLRDEPLIRLRSTFGLLSFATFSVLWTTMAYLLAARYHLGPAVIGLFGLAGAAGAVTASVAGRRSDRGRTRSSTVAATALLLASWLALWLGAAHLWLFDVGVVVLDIGAQGLHITNQGAIYRIRPDARSRVTSIYMVCYFIGGAAGSVLATTVYGRWAWSGVCVLGAGFAAAAAVLALLAATWLRHVEAVAATPAGSAASASSARSSR
jgi:predicted MFS family arabinose efflux permease